MSNEISGVLTCSCERCLLSNGYPVYLSGTKYHSSFIYLYIGLHISWGFTRPTIILTNSVYVINIEKMWHRYTVVPTLINYFIKVIFKMLVYKSI
jgi:hypothetical protein